MYIPIMYYKSIKFISFVAFSVTTNASSPILGSFRTSECLTFERH